MAGLDPAIHVFVAVEGKRDVDARHKAGHDDPENWFSAHQIKQPRNQTTTPVRSRDEFRPSLKPVAVPQNQREQGMPGVWLARSLVRKRKKHTS